MATYIPNLTDIFPEPSLYKPDIGFFDSMLKRKQAQYDEGVSKAISARDMIRNAPLSDFANIEMRNKYLKDADEALKNIASADFSLPQNVSNAMNIFSPFWEDDIVLEDMQKTKGLTNGINTLLSYQNSTDPKIREQYSGVAMKYLTNDLERLRNANRNREAYKKVEGRKAVPFTNLESYLSDEAKKDGLEVKYDDPNGPYLVSTINGQRSQQKYATWATNKIGNNFYDQFNVIGTVEREERAKIYKKMYPQMSEGEIDDVIAKEHVKELDEGYNKRKREYEVEKARVESLLSSIAKTSDPKNEALFESLTMDLAKLEAEKAAFDKEYAYFDQPFKDKKINEIKTNPSLYFATLAKQRTINNWATARASIESKIVKENGAWASAENIRLRQAELNRNISNDAWSRQMDLIEAQQKAAEQGQKGTGKKTVLTDAQGREIPEPTSDLEKFLFYNGFSGIDVTKTAPTALDLFNKLQEAAFADAHNLIFDQRGILILAKNKGIELDDTEIAHVATALKNEMGSLKPGQKDYGFTKEQKDATNKLSERLLADKSVQAAGITKITDPGTLRNALIAYAKGYFTERNGLAKEGNDIPLNSDEHEAMLRYAAAVAKLDTYNANEANRKELIEKNILTNKDYQSLVVDRGGKKDLISLSDIEKQINVNKIDGVDSNGNKITLNKDDISLAYAQGRIVDYIPTKGQNMIAGQSQGRIGYMGYSIVDEAGNVKASVYGKLNANPGATTIDGPEGFKDFLGSIRNLNAKHKSSKEFSAIYSTAQESVVPKLLMYRNQSGQQGAAFTMVFLKNKTMAEGDKTALIIDQALNSSNAEIYDDSGNPVSAETAGALRLLLKDEGNMENYLGLSGVSYIAQGVKGKRTIRLYMGKPTKESDVEEIGGVPLKKLSGKFDIVLNDGPTAPELDNLPNNTGFQIHQSLARGKVFKSDALIEASGMKFRLTPNVLSSEGGVDEEPSYVTMDLEYILRENKKDPETGNLTTELKTVKKAYKFNLKGENAKSPDEMVNYLYGLYYQTMLENRARQQEFQNYVEAEKQSGSPTSTIDFKERLRQKGLGHLIN
jgi:hypothetical protein